MLKRVLTGVILGALIASPALAQNALNSTAATGDGIGTFGHSNFRTTDSQARIDFGGPGQVAGEGWSDFTNTQGVGTINGPDLPGTPGFAGPGGISGASTSAPFVGTFTAPGNMALKQIGRKTLPPTRLESFVRNSGFNDRIYGDEGEDGLPPYFGFDSSHRIERGINMPELTTGHKSDAPSAWGYPQ